MAVYSIKELLERYLAVYDKFETNKKDLTL
jgi:hypothetical protein